MGTPHTPETFWARARRDGPCLLWQGCTQRGYGAVRWQGVATKAHRVAWILTYGPIPPGLHVCHTCDRKTCIEPLHLFLGTAQDNIRDHVAKGRTHLQARFGEASATSKLTTAQVIQVRDRAAAGEQLAAISRSMGVSKSNIWHIARGDRRSQG